MRVTLTIAIGTLLVLPAQAAEFKVDLEIPQLKVAEYHRPYVAVWVEGADQKAVANLAVWYMTKATSEGQGTKWLPDLRQWWRKTGRTLKVPVDGVTGPTRPAGRHALKFDQKHRELSKLAPGSYTLVVEAAREVGGRELLKIPFTWPAKAPQSGKAQGKTELGAVALTFAP
jgi:hypothetical protein